MATGHEDFKTVVVLRGVYAGAQISLSVDALGRLRAQQVQVSDLAGVHGDLAGLDADDHPQYALDGYIDHGALLGLTDYDHDQYVRKNLSQALTGTKIYRDVDDSLIHFDGSTGGEGHGGRIGVFGADHPSSPGYVSITVPNAAKNAEVLVLRVAGVTDTPYLDLLSHPIKSLADGIDPQDAATKHYVDNNAAPQNVFVIRLDTDFEWSETYYAPINTIQIPLAANETIQFEWMLFLGDSDGYGTKFILEFPDGAVCNSIFWGDTSSLALYRHERATTSLTTPTDLFHTQQNDNGLVTVTGTVKNGDTAGTFLIKICAVAG